MDDTIEPRKAHWRAVLDAHGGYEHVAHCPTHGVRRCPAWTEAWTEYEKALDDERSAHGHVRHYAWLPKGRTFN